MGRADDHCAGCARELGEHEADGKRVRRVQPRRRLVGDDRAWARGHGSGDRCPLPLAGRELGDGPLSVLCEADRGECSERTVSCVARLHTAQRQRELDVLARTEEGDEPDSLADERQPCPPQLGAAGAIERGERDAVEDDRAGVGEVEPGEELQERRLAGARRPGNGAEPPAGERCVQPVDRRRSSEPPPQPAYLEQRLCCFNTKWGENGFVAWLGRSLC